MSHVWLWCFFFLPKNPLEGKPVMDRVHRTLSNLKCQSYTTWMGTFFSIQSFFMVRFSRLPSLTASSLGQYCSFCFSGKKRRPYFQSFNYKVTPRSLRLPRQHFSTYSKSLCDAEFSLFLCWLYKCL